MKSEQYHTVRDIFKETTLNITKEGRKHFGAVIRGIKYKRDCVKSKISEWVKDLPLLSKIAYFCPHAPHCAFTFGCRQKLNCIIQMNVDIKNVLQPVENII